MRKMIYQKTYHLCVAKTEIQDDSEYRWYYGDDSDMDGNYKEFNTFDEFWVWAGDGNRPFFHGDVTQWHSIFSDEQRARMSEQFKNRVRNQSPHGEFQSGSGEEDEGE